MSKKQIELFTPNAKDFQVTQNWDDRNFEIDMVNLIQKCIINLNKFGKYICKLKFVTNCCMVKTDKIARKKIKLMEEKLINIEKQMEYLAAVSSKLEPIAKTDNETTQRNVENEEI